VVIGGSLLLYALRAPALEAADGARGFAPFSRETLLLANNLLLACACAMVLLGTLYPLLADALDLGKISVGPPYFGLLFALLMAPGRCCRSARWCAGSDQRAPLLAMLLPWLALALVAGVLAFLVARKAGGRPPPASAAAWVAGGTLRFAWQRWRKQGRFTPKWPACCSPIGIAVFLVGALLVEALNVQREVALAPGNRGGGRWCPFEGVSERRPQLPVRPRHLSVLRDGRELPCCTRKNAVPGGGQVMTEAGIRRSGDDLYVALGEPLGNGAWAVRVHVKPFVRWIWLGGLLMALGGFVTAADRRFRKMPMSARRIPDDIRFFDPSRAAGGRRPGLLGLVGCWPGACTAPATRARHTAVGADRQARAQVRPAGAAFAGHPHHARNAGGATCSTCGAAGALPAPRNTRC
jgi:cytochrome c-type biogenesis protein CcmF